MGLASDRFQKRGLGAELARWPAEMRVSKDAIE
jgi:hypothetical protein